MYKIQANASGTRSIEISDEHLQTISKYSLFDGLVDSNGFVDEPVLDKLKFHVRSLLENTVENDKALLDLCLDVIYNNNMKALDCRTSSRFIASGLRLTLRRMQKPSRLMANK